MAIEKFIGAYQLAKSENHHELKVASLNAIASLKSEYGEDQEALSLQLESFDYLRQHANKIPHYYDTYLVSLDNLALSYLQLNMVDSARVYTKKALDWALRHDDMEAHRELRILEAQVNYHDMNLVKARDSILKYFDDMEKDGQADLLFYLGMIEGKLGHEKEKLAYFERMHQTLAEIDFPPIDNTKELYRFLMLKGRSQNDSYLKRWAYYDSLNTAMAHAIRTTSFKDFDVPRIQEMEEGILSNLLIWRRKNIILWSVICLLLPLVIGVCIVYYRTNGKLKRIKNLPVEETFEELKEVDGLDISPDVIRRIRHDLKKWEGEKGFLDPSLDQKSLAMMLHTNDTYISLIINHYRNKNFSTYLKELRIEYALNTLRRNPQISFGKSVVQLAEKFGFKSKELFARSMKSKIGITPAVFLKQLKSDNL
ncbi:helix-turn-helix domain-containing protein [Maribacter sp. 2307ULW6-5]|uniref:helix-turn-helix domain-containing protein n=1 Tax=Maribacter sp. 2307ULW6-5 TaxID=3386275 RepID=UPI0039BC97F7